MLKLRTLLVLMLLSSIATAIFAQETINLGDVIEGAASEAPVEYQLFLEEGQSVRITLESAEFDTILEFYDEAGELLISNDDMEVMVNTNSQLVFRASSSGTYTIKANAYSPDGGVGPTGAYTLTIEEVEINDVVEAGELVYNETRTVETNGTIRLLFSFQGTAGDVLNITAVSATDEDSRIYLANAEGEQITYDDDAGVEWNPALYRVELLETGEYYVIIEGFAGAALFAPMDVRIEETELLLLNEGAQTISLSGETKTNSVTLDTVEGQRYRITLTLNQASESSLYVYVSEDGESYANTRLNITAIDEFTFAFTANTTGRASVEFEFFGIAETIEITATLEN